MIEAGSPVVADLLARLGGDANALTGPFITEAAREGDPTARELLADIGEWLGIGLANLAAAFDPGLFVIGGGVSAADEMLIGPAREAFRAPAARPRLPSRGAHRARRARQRRRPHRGRRAGARRPLSRVRGATASTCCGS